MPSVYIETYGCQMNVSDSELMLGKLAAVGYEIVDGPEGADVILVNTCAIRDNAEQRVIGRLGELRRFMKRDTILGVTGCMAQRLGPKLLESNSRVSLVVGPDAYRALPHLIDGARRGERFTATDFDIEEQYEDFHARRFDGVKAWIPVQRGCDYRCTYCIVPYTRGPERSRQLAEVVRETREVAAQGLTEVVLLGQTVNSYTDGTHDFADLLRAVGAVPGIRRVRFTSPHPNDFSDRVIARWPRRRPYASTCTCPCRAGRAGRSSACCAAIRARSISRRAARLRAAIPGLGLTTDIIVGFPGETDDEFAETISAVREVGFDDAYMFKFSMRDGTPATRCPAELLVEDAVIDARFETLKDVVRGIARERNMKRLGERREVLIEKEARKGGDLLQARSRDFKTVIVPGDPSMIGTYCTVELTGTTGSTFTGMPRGGARAAAAGAQRDPMTRARTGWRSRSRAAVITGSCRSSRGP